MCFSATASFAAAGFLGLIGAYTLSENKKKSYLMLASIPLLFAIQQAAEGVVWLTLPYANSLLHQIAMYTFLTFAGIIWPLWSPISLWIIEQDAFRKKLLSGFILLGGIIASHIVWTFTRTLIQAHIVSCSIDYRYIPADFLPPMLGLFIYTVATVGPCFVSSLQHSKFLGTAWLIALFVTLTIKYETTTSVWCFFAALLSILITWIIKEEQAHHKP